MFKRLSKHRSHPPLPLIDPWPFWLWSGFYVHLFDDLVFKLKDGHDMAHGVRRYINIYILIYIY
jgi:hypothetical protein